MLPTNLTPFYNISAYRSPDGASCEIDLRLSGELLTDITGFAEAIQALLNEHFGEDVISNLTYFNTTQASVRIVDNTPPPPEPEPDPTPPDTGGGDTGGGDEVPPPDDTGTGTDPVTDPPPEHPADDTGTGTSTETPPDTTGTDTSTDTGTTEPPANDTTTQ
jgi:hypothetical protein